MKVKVSTIAFSKNAYLVDCLRKEFPGAVVNDAGVRMNDVALIEYFSDAEAVIVGLESITASVLDRLPNLKMIAKYGVGLDNIDVEACKSRNVYIGWTGGVNKTSVAEMTLGFMLALSRNLYCTSNQLKNLVWNKSGGTQLTGKTIGIIGLGNIGKEVVRLLSPFGCEILVNDINDVSEYAREHNLSIVTKEELYKKADIVSVHIPLTPETKGLIDKDVFSQMKHTSFLINTARGGIINETDLQRALSDKMIAGAALDVYEVEPPVKADLLSSPALICTPHTGGNSYEAVVAMGVSAIKHIVNYRNNMS